MAEQDQEDRDFSPTYKSLFLGACIIIGSAFGWWFSNFITTLDLAHRGYEASIRELEKRLSAVETREDRGSWERDAIKRDVADLKRKVDK